MLKEIETTITEENYKRSGQLIIVRGLPGVGKSTIIEHTSHAIHPDSEVTIINPDNIDIEALDIFASEDGREGNERQWKYRYTLAETLRSLEQGKTVIWDQPWGQLKGIEITLENISILLENNLPKVTIVDLYAPKDLAMQRLNFRIANGGHGPTQETANQMYSEYEELIHLDIPEGLQILAIGLDATGNPTEIAQELSRIIG